MKEILKKIIVIMSIIVVLLIGYGIDSIIAKSYSIDFLSVERIQDEPLLDNNGKEIPLDVGISDGYTLMNIKVRLTRHNTPVSKHVLYIKTNRNIVGRMETNDEGIINFEYKCYLSATPNDIVFSIDDENNSIFIFTPAKGTYTLKMIAPISKNASNISTDDIFFDID